MRFFLFVLSLPFFLLLVGCGTAPEHRLAPPGVTITGFSEAKTPALILRLVNANTVPLVVRTTTHTLYLGETRLSRITDDTPIGLPALGATSHAVPLPPAAVSDLRAWFEKHPGETDLLIESTFEVIIGDDDFVVLRSSGRGTVQSP